MLSSILVSQGLFAQSLSINPNAGNSAQMLQQSALANRQLADNLYRQGLADEKRAWQSFPPDVGLLMKAAQMGLDGMKADDQARASARSAIESMRVGDKAGGLDHSQYGLDPKLVKQLATTTSPYWNQVQSTMAGYGVKMSPDGRYINTPLGSLPSSMSSTELGAAAKAFLAKIGMSADSVDKGIQAAMSTREQLSQSAMAAMRGSGFDGDSRRGLAGSVGSAGESGVNSGQIGLALESDPSAEGTTSDVNVNESEFAESQRRFALARQELNKKLGIAGDSVQKTSSLGSSDQDIFQMVHRQYRKMLRQSLLVDSDTFAN